ncbi:Protein of unknown function [Chitinophaga sp. CF418]|nr:Protein of unknown function [Chitinophaga sp. CF418]
MSWSYRKRIKIIPGVHLNISGKGISTTIGVKGASVNFSADGTFLNTGIPALGIYNRQKISSGKGIPPGNTIPHVATIEPMPRGNIFSVLPNEVTSNDMQGIKDTLIAARRQRMELGHDLSKICTALSLTKIRLILSYVFIIGLLKRSIPQKLRHTISSQLDTIAQIKEQIDNSCMKMDVEFDPDLKGKFEVLTDAFKQLSHSEKIWDVTNAEAQNRVAARSAASTLVMKREVAIGIKPIPDIKSEFAPLWLKNANGADLYFYPGFIIMYDSRDHFGIIGLNELEFHYEYVRFVETGTVPKDSKIIDRTWAKVNKNGSPDKRFKNNYQIPIVRYGCIRLKNRNGLHEEYEFSNYEATELFGRAFSSYISSVRG